MLFPAFDAPDPRWVSRLPGAYRLFLQSSAPCRSRAVSIITTMTQSFCKAGTVGSGILEGKSGPPPVRQYLETLSPSERQVLTLIAEGHSLKAIAARLYRSVDTVKSHRRALGKKLGSSNRVELARFAIEHGLVTIGNGAAELRACAPAGISAAGDVPVALVDPEGRCATISPGFARVVGLDASGLNDRRIGDFMRLDTPLDLGEFFGRVASGCFVRTTAVVRRQDQTLLSATAHFLPLPTPARHAYVVLSDLAQLPRCVEAMTPSLTRTGEGSRGDHRLL